MSLGVISPLKFLKRFYLFIFREKGREGEREGEECERYIDQLPLACLQMGTWPTTWACALTGNQSSDLLVHRLAL